MFILITDKSGRILVDHVVSSRGSSKNLLGLPQIEDNSSEAKLDQWLKASSLNKTSQADRFSLRTNTDTSSTEYLIFLPSLKAQKLLHMNGLLLSHCGTAKLTTQ